MSAGQHGRPGGTAAQKDGKTLQESAGKTNLKQWQELLLLNLPNQKTGGEIKDFKNGMLV